jgi:nitrate reductase NapAB chaperone NapD
MAVVSAIVEINEGMCEAVLSSLAQISDLNVYGFKDSQIVTVIEGDSVEAVEKIMKHLYTIEHVTGVYPVFAGDYE